VDFSSAPACGLVVTANGYAEVVLCREQYAEPVFSDRYGRHAYCGYISSNHWYDDLIFIVRSPCLEFGLTRKKYFFFSSKTQKSPTSEVSISNGCRLGFRLMHLTVYLGMYHFLVLLIDNHVTEFYEDDISNPKVCQVLTGKLTRSLFEGFRVVYCAHTDHLSRGSNQRFAELCPGRATSPSIILLFRTHAICATVWGPEPVNLGYIGAPLATAISYNVVSIASVIYGVFYVPKTAWHPISRRSFTGLGILVQLGLAGVGRCLLLCSSSVLT
jgi:hypothetical protein